MAEQTEGGTGCEGLSDAVLVADLKRLVGDERASLVGVLRRLAEMDRRRLWEGMAFTSLFDYCVRELKYAEGAAARRIYSARAGVKFPMVLRMLERGEISLGTVYLLSPHFTPQNYRELLSKAAGKSKRDVEALVASLAPKPAPVERIRRVEPLVAPTPAAIPATGEGAADLPLLAPIEAAVPAGAEAQPGAQPAAPQPPRVHFSFTAEEAVLERFERAREVLRHKFPAGKLEEIFAAALEALLERHDPERRLARKARRRAAAMRAETGTKEPAAEGARRAEAGNGRRVPQPVRDAAWERDEGRCAFIAPDGRRCGARAWLEYDHVRPWALGGPSDDSENVRLLCRTHNQMLARRVFGARAVRGEVSDAAARGP